MNDWRFSASSFVLTADTSLASSAFKSSTNLRPQCFLDAFQIVGASPETLVRVEGSTVATNPIAGTRPRGATDDEDAAMAEELNTMRNLFTKSVVAKGPIAAGTVLSEELLTVKKPGSGIPAAQLPTLIGRKVTQDLDADALIDENDLCVP